MIRYNRNRRPMAFLRSGTSARQERLGSRGSLERCARSETPGSLATSRSSWSDEHRPPRRRRENGRESEKEIGRGNDPETDRGRGR
ncbi:hypothetical protein JYU34_012875 [Plutella xylostella]|uniref:Uncharacterized protein n=1 Tax=Plutella xylostella TaxID=51655 RepID=A0ABQ7QCN1_PLUXY|nr:hypothetical protein JYU34_012875 [Plutella xylostella]